MTERLEYRIGRFTLKPSRQLLDGDTPVSIGRKALEILSVLARAEGALVTKTELMAAVWPKTIVEDNVIQVHIAALRKILGTDAELLSTVHGLGYRVSISPVETQASDFAVTAAPDRTENRLTDRLHFRRGLAAGAFVLLVIGAGATWLLWPAPRWVVESSRPFASTLALEDYPAFSPNAAMLAYTAGPEGGRRTIYVRSTVGGEAARISSDGYDDVSPSWSSDNAHLAYVAQKAGEPCHIMLATVPAGETHEVGRCGAHQESKLTWQPGTSFLYYVDGRNFGEDAIFRLDLDTGARVKIIGQKFGPIRDLRCSPDGKSLVYLGSDGSYGINTVMVHDLASGREKKLGAVMMTMLGTWPNAIAWTDDSKTVLASSSSGVGSEIIAYPVSGAPSYRVYEAATGIGRLAAGGGMLAVETDIGRQNLARVSPTPIAQPDVIDPANSISVSPSFAPDGTLAFISNRSGTNAVWIAKPGAAPVMLFDGGAGALFRVIFSPDGSRLAVVSDSSDGRITVRVLTTSGAGVTSFEMPSIGPGLPTWTPDGKGLIVFDTGTMRALRIDVDNPTLRQFAAPAGWIGVTVRRDGVFAGKIVHSGLWQIDRTPRLISESYPPVESSLIAFWHDSVLVPDFNAEGGPRFLAQPLAGGPDRVAGYAPGAHDVGPAGRLAVNPKTDEIIYVADVLRDTNIELLKIALQ